MPAAGQQIPNKQQLNNEEQCFLRGPFQDVLGRSGL
jgi:hypothetical protein